MRLSDIDSANNLVELFLKRDLKEVDVMQFRKEMDTEPFTRETRYVTAEEAAERLKQDVGSLLEAVKPPAERAVLAA